MKKTIPGIDYIGISTPFYCNNGKGIFVLHKRGKKCRDEIGKWDFGGGQLEFGQSVEENVLREVMEEYGCKGVIQEMLPPHSILRIQNGIKTHWLSIPFFIRINVKEAKINESDKMSELGLFTLNSLPRPLHTAVRKTMKMYKKNFDKYKHSQ